MFLPEILEGFKTALSKKNMQGDAQNLLLINYLFTTISSTVFSNFHESQQKQHVVQKLKNLCNNNRILPLKLQCKT